MPAAAQFTAGKVVLLLPQYSEQYSADSPYCSCPRTSSSFPLLAERSSSFQPAVRDLHHPPLPAAHTHLPTPDPELRGLSPAHSPLLMPLPTYLGHSTLLRHIRTSHALGFVDSGPLHLKQPSTYAPVQTIPLSPMSTLKRPTP